MKEGWICPRCGKANAPFIVSCDCKLDTEDECPCGGKHQWRIISVWSTSIGNGSTLVCSKCKANKQVYDSGIT